ncbi:MAG: AraC family transcriptional regulator [Gammaproteobacteria bacterium]|nr:AraC family transcriptional regulator [Gammaproteobacteria bacterium]
MRPGIGINAKHLRKAMISISDLKAFISEALRITGNRALGLRMGEELELSDFGALGYAMECSRTFGDALELLSRYHDTSGEIWSPVIGSTTHGDIEIYPRFDFSAGHLEFFFVDEMITGIARVAALLTGESISPRELRPRIESRSDLRRYRTLFPCRVVPAKRTPKIILDSSVLKLRCIHADPDLAQHCAAICERLQTELKSKDFSLIGEINRILYALPGDPPDRNQIANNLNISPRTLSRRLAAEGTNYQEILDNMRSGLAIDYLTNSRMSLEAISELVGFSDKSSLIRAFRRWTGKRPSQIRAGVKRLSSQSGND